MKRSILASRNETAQRRLIDACAQLAKRYELEAPEMKVKAASMTGAMLQRERIADFLEAMLEATKS